MGIHGTCSNCYFGEQCKCGYCHQCGHQWYWRAASTVGPQHDTPREPLVFRTQKVKGIYALLRAQTRINVITPNRVLDVTKSLLENTSGINFPKFARPCPVTPRHGFVDSRVVKDYAELQVVVDETRAADPLGEVMLMPFLDSAYNSVWVPRMLTVGEGNDGATAGHNTITFPLIGLIDQERLSEDMLNAAGIGEDQDPYIEAVHEEHGLVWLTQLRGGPKLLSGSKDFLPCEVVVQEVIKVDPKMDLLKWETVIIEAKDRPGVVVYHPGGSPADHFSVHARSFNIPVCITFEPTVGATLQADVSTPQLDPAGVLKGLVLADMFALKHSTGGSRTDAAAAVSLLLHTLHHSSAFGGDTSWWLGFGVGLMLRYGSIALRGEARHIKGNGHYPQRDYVYSKSINHTLQRQRASVPGLVHILRYGIFRGNVGGIKWARCGSATSKLFDAVGVLSKDPTQNSVNNLLRAFNFAVNQAHNGGWWLNKFIDANAFNEIQEGDLSEVLKIAPFVWRAGKGIENITNEDILVRMLKWAKWKSIQLVPPKIIKARLVTLPGVVGLTVEVTDRLLKEKHKPIMVPINKLLKVLPTAIRGQLYVELGEKGMSLLMNIPHQDPLVLWEEDGIEEVEVPKK